MKLNLFEKLLVGVYSIRIGKKYISFNKMGPFMFLMITLAAMFQENSYKYVPVLFWIGIVGILVGTFAFFYIQIFPSRRPKTKEDVDKFTIFINEKKA